jgi:hypothetical protein
MRVHTTDSNTNDVADKEAMTKLQHFRKLACKKHSLPRGVSEAVRKILATQPGESDVQRNSAEQLPILDLAAIAHHQSLRSGINVGDLTTLAKAHSLLRQKLGNTLPDSSSSTVLGKTENSVGSPTTLGAIST